MNMISILQKGLCADPVVGTGHAGRHVVDGAVGAAATQDAADGIGRDVPDAYQGFLCLAADVGRHNQVRELGERDPIVR
jgi:hypothetical protein